MDHISTAIEYATDSDIDPVAETQVRLRNGHQLQLIYPHDTLSAFTKTFPVCPIVKKINEKVLIGRNCIHYKLDIIILDPRISRLQCELFFNKKEKKFQIMNLTEAKFRVNEHYLEKNESAFLNDGDSLVFDGLAIGKEQGKDRICFTAWVNLCSYEGQTMYNVDVTSGFCMSQFEKLRIAVTKPLTDAVKGIMINDSKPVDDEKDDISQLRKDDENVKIMTAHTQTANAQAESTKTPSTEEILPACPENTQQASSVVTGYINGEDKNGEDKNGEL